MHGSSSVPQDLLAVIRQYGGNMKETYGVPVEEIQQAIKFGVRKINIDTDIRLAMTGAVRKFLAENPEKFDMRDWMKPAREAAKQICKQRYIQFGCEGQAGKIKGAAPAGGRGRSTPRASWRRSCTDRSCDNPGARRLRRALFFCPPPMTSALHTSVPHFPAAARARQGARQLRRRQRPHPDGRQRPAVGLRRDHGRADSGQGRNAHADGAVLVRQAGPPVPQPPDRRGARERGDAGRSAAGHGPLDAGQAAQADSGGGRGARLPGRQRLEGVPGHRSRSAASSCRRA